MRWCGIDTDAKVITLTFDFENEQEVLALLKEDEFFGEHLSLEQEERLIKHIPELRELKDDC